MTYIYFEVKLWVILTHNPKYNNIHALNSLQDIRKNHWTMEYRSQWPTLIFRSNIWSYWFILPKYDISNSLQDTRQNHWTMKYKSQWPIFILRSNFGSYFVCLCWGLTSQSTIFQSCRDRATASWVINQYFRGVKCLAQGHNTAVVGIEPPTSRSGVRHYNTEPPRSPLGHTDS